MFARFVEVLLHSLGNKMASLRNALSAIIKRNRNISLNLTIRFISPYFWKRKTIVQPRLIDTFMIERMIFTDKSTIGDLSIDGTVVCQTLEDTCRAVKVYGKTAIPSGKYEVVITYSERFKRPLPLLLDVPGYSGVRIHTGNTADNTEGCILVGMKRGENAIYDSRKAFDLVFPEIQERLSKGKLYLAILGGTHVDDIRTI